MSNYLKLSKHPITGKWEEAQWLDNHCGHHNYGVQFSDGEVFDVRDIVIETKERPVKAKKATKSNQCGSPIQETILGTIRCANEKPCRTHYEGWDVPANQKKVKFCKCKKPVMDNSFVFQRGGCLICKKPIAVSDKYPLRRTIT